MPSPRLCQFIQLSTPRKEEYIGGHELVRRIKQWVHQNLPFTQDLSRNSKQRVEEFINPNSF